MKIIEAEACPDHIHLFVEIPPKLSISGFMGYLKGKSSTMLYEQFGELKYKYRNREFWCRGYYVDTVGKNETRIAEYGREHLCAMDPADFEKLIADYFLRRGFVRAEVIGHSGDRGVDVLATNTQGELELIQCKRYRSGNNIGSTPIC